MVVIMMYEHYVIATKRKLIDLGPPSMDVIVLQTQRDSPLAGIDSAA